MRRFAIALVAMLAPALPLLVNPATAADWGPMIGKEIEQALTGRTLAYPDTTQDFRRSGRTLYIHKGRESWGYWRVQNDQYCSQWPPNDLWACYGMARSGDRVRFVGEGDDITDAVYAD